MFASAGTLLDSIADATRLRDQGLTLVALATADAMEAAAFGAVGLRSSRSYLRTHTPTLAGDAGEAESCRPFEQRSRCGGTDDPHHLVPRPVGFRGGRPIFCCTMMTFASGVGHESLVN